MDQAPHPRKNWTFIYRKYWHTRGANNWVFCTEDATLIKAGTIPRKKHIKIHMGANAYIDWKYVERRKIRYNVVLVKRD